MALRPLPTTQEKHILESNPQRWGNANARLLSGYDERLLHLLGKLSAWLENQQTTPREKR